MTPAPRRVALYTRVSTDLQANREEGSLDTQEARLRAVVGARREPSEVTMVFREEGESGKSLDRPQLQRLLAAIRSEQVDLVMVTRVDRLSRSILDFFEVHRLMQDHGVEFYSMNESFDTATPMGRAMLNLVLVFAALEREQTSERTRTAMQARAARGLWNGGSPPLGYDSKGNGHLDVNEKEAELVRLIFSQYLELHSTHKLARWLNDRGYRQKAFSSRRRGATGGKTFSIPVLQGMLTNRLYLGEIEHKGEVFTGQHEAIIDRADFERVERLFADHAKGRRGPPLRAKYDYLLTGLVRCSCGYALTTSAGGSSERTYHYYRCVGIQKHDRHECAVKQMNAPSVDTAVMEVVRDAARNPALIESAVGHANRLAAETVAPLRERAAGLRRDLRDAEAEATRVLDALLSIGATDSPTARRRLTDADQRVAELRSAVAEADAQLAVREEAQLDADVVVQALRSFDGAFEHLTLDEKREFLRLLLKQVTVHKDRVVVDLYEGRRAQRFLVALARGRKARNPGRVDQGLVSGVEWLPPEGPVARRDDDSGASQVLVATTAGRTAASAGGLV